MCVCGIVQCQRVFYGYVTITDERRIAHRDSSQVGGDMNGQFTYYWKLLPDSVSVVAVTIVQTVSKFIHFLVKKFSNHLDIQARLKSEDMFLIRSGIILNSGLSYYSNVCVCVCAWCSMSDKYRSQMDKNIWAVISHTCV